MHRNLTNGVSGPLGIARKCTETSQMVSVDRQEYQRNAPERHRWCQRAARNTSETHRNVTNGVSGPLGILAKCIETPQMVSMGR